MTNRWLGAAATCCLLAIVGAAVGNFAGWITLDGTKAVALAATIGWFALATPWLGKADEEE